MKKRLALLMTAVMVIGLVGCGEKTTTEVTDNEVAAVETYMLFEETQLAKSAHAEALSKLEEQKGSLEELLDTSNVELEELKASEGTDVDVINASENDIIKVQEAIDVVESQIQTANEIKDAIDDIQYKLDNNEYSDQDSVGRELANIDDYTTVLKMMIAQYSVELEQADDQEVEEQAVEEQAVEEQAVDTQEEDVDVE